MCQAGWASVEVPAGVRVVVLSRGGCRSLVKGGGCATWTATGDSCKSSLKKSGKYLTVAPAPTPKKSDEAKSTCQVREYTVELAAL